MMNAQPNPEGTMAEETDQPKQEADEKRDEQRRQTREADPESPEAIREDVAEDDRFQSTDN
jgi:hypothetical protein